MLLSAQAHRKTVKLLRQRGDADVPSKILGAKRLIERTPAVQLMQVP
jgi:hypothetical protein